MAEPAQDQLFFLLTLGTVGVLTLALFIILFFFIYQKRIHLLQQQKQKMEIGFQEQMSQYQLEAQEKDRKRMAADLHDSVGSLLWGAKLNASFIERSVPFSTEARESHAELMSILDQAIGTVRRIAWQLTPEAFQHAGLTKSLERLCNTIDGKGIRVTYTGSDPSIGNPGHALHVFRIVQELLSNSIKHAEATSITVTLSSEETELMVTVEDDGKGYLPTLLSDGVGWWSIRQRARQIGAKTLHRTIPYGPGPFRDHQFTFGAMRKDLHIYLADDHTVVRKGMLRLLKTFSRVGEVEEASNGRELIQLVEKKQPDAVILDVEMPVLGGIETSRYLGEHFPDVKILILTMHTEEVFVIRLMDLGVHGLLSKSCGPDEVEKALYAIVDKDFYRNDIMERALRRLTGNGETNKTNQKLTTRELEILLLICQELSPGEISERLQISEKTFFNHRANILQKTNCRNNVGLLKYAHEKGLFHLNSPG